MPHDATSEANIFLTDENVDGDAIDVARKQWQVQIVRATDAGLKQTPDPAILEYAIQHNYVLVTGNFRDFPALLKQWTDAGKHHPGAIIITAKHLKNSLLIAEMLALYATEALADRV